MQMLHSIAKSLNSFAVGFAISEGKLKLDDLVIDYFREYLPEQYDKRLEKLTVRNLLTMAASSCALSTCFNSANGSWITHYFTYELPNEPGTTFLYDTGASYILSALVSKTMKQTSLEVIKERLFAPMGITDVEWLESPEGNTVGGWGLYMKAPDVAKIAILLANMGKWKGKTLVPENYFKEATKKQIDTPEEDYPVCGYGYQFWITEGNTIALYGLFGNVIVVKPEKRLAVVITAGANQEEKKPGSLISRIIDEELFLPTVRVPLEEDLAGEQALEGYLNELKLPYAAGKAFSPAEEEFFEKRIVFEENESGICELEIDRISEKEIAISFQMNERKMTAAAGFENWISGEAVFDAPQHCTNSFSYAFEDDNTLLLKQYCLNTSGYTVYKFCCSGESIEGVIKTSVKVGGTIPLTLQGKLTELS